MELTVEYKVKTTINLDESLRDEFLKLSDSDKEELALKQIESNQYQTKIIDGIDLQWEE